MRPSKLAEFGKLVALLWLSSLPASVAAQSHEQVLYAFGGASGCAEPVAPLIADTRGNLYGTTTGGGSDGDGCVFKLSRTESGWKEAVLYSFDGSDGSSPSGALTFDKMGNLFGTTRGGGVYGVGVVFELSPLANGEWAETVLYSFGNGDDGGSPEFSLIFDDAGNLYGTTEYGGAGRTGTVFKLTPGQDGWVETILYAFPHSITGPNGANPVGALVMDGEGRLYGDTQEGGTYGCGAVFELVPSESGYKEKVIYSFNGSDGLQPFSGLTIDRNGFLYGTTSSGGDTSVCYYVGCGIVFQLIKGANGKWTENVLLATNGFDGSYTTGPVVFDSAGNLYGVNELGGISGMGSVFELTLLLAAHGRKPCSISSTSNFRTAWMVRIHTRESFSTATWSSEPL
jgi:uncharacterized repeat protein (TIGR03803 family)